MVINRLARVKDVKRLYVAMGVAGAWASFQAVLSFSISKWLKRPVWVPQPLSVSIEPTTSCNLRCPECISGTRTFTRDTGALPLDHFSKMAAQFRPDTFYLNLYFQGEPFLNPDFFEMIKAAKKLGYYVSTSTNGHYLTKRNCQKLLDAGLDRLIVSIDGTTPDVYKKYRVGGSLHKVLNGLRNLKEAKAENGGNGPYTLFQFIVFDHNEHQMSEAKTMALEYGVDEFTVKTAQIYSNGHGAVKPPSNEKLGRYKLDAAGNYVLQADFSESCWRMWSGVVVSWDGLVLPCCFDKDADYVMGNILESEFRKVWKSDPYQAFRKQLFTDRSQLEMCKNCTEGTKVFAA